VAHFEAVWRLSDSRRAFSSTRSPSIFTRLSWRWDTNRSSLASTFSPGAVGLPRFLSKAAPIGLSGVRGFSAINGPPVASANKRLQCERIL
jgi:hypothetical protein